MFGNVLNFLDNDIIGFVRKYFKFTLTILFKHMLFFLCDLLHYFSIIYFSFSFL